MLSSHPSLVTEEHTNHHRTANSTIWLATGQSWYQLINYLSSEKPLATARCCRFYQLIICLGLDLMRWRWWYLAAALSSWLPAPVDMRMLVEYDWLVDFSRGRGTWPLLMARVSRKLASLLNVSYMNRTLELGHGDTWYSPLPTRIYPTLAFDLVVKPR